MKHNRLVATLLIMLMLMGMTSCKGKDEELLSDGGTEDVVERNTAVQKAWNGDWYGWWEIKNTTGGYTYAEGYYWDVLCKVNLNEDGDGTVILWDEKYSYEEPLAIANISVYTNLRKNDMGIAMSTGGWFLADEEVYQLKQSEWIMDTAACKYESCITFDGHVDDDVGSFDYYFMMKPWGRSWDDVAADDEDKLPYYYYDWYIPLIENNCKMPDTLLDESGLE